MLFNSIEFAIYLPLVFLFYWFVFPRSLKWQNFFVLVVSYLFYGWWDWRFLLLIALTSGLSFASGILIEETRDRRWAGRSVAWWVNAANIFVNLSILGLFKYYNFFVDSFHSLLTLFGVEMRPSSMWTLHLILPVGISFYTFQALSYTIDVYKRQLSASRNWVAFFAYVSFFPQLVAGPIERATNLLPQFDRPRKFDYDKAADGMRQMLWGFFKKIVIADNCAVSVDYIFQNYETLPASTLWLGALQFTFQIYCDFSGYSDIAIGSARLFGIDLMRNFNLPYFSRDIAEFWRRWHISLTTWFRDYIYIPLGGSRGTKWKGIRNTFVIFLVSGLWHGANWTFVLWGLYHALLFVPLLVMGRNRRNTNQVAENRFLPTPGELLQMSSTFVLAMLGWVIFRAANVTQMVGYFKGMFSSSIFSTPLHADKCGSFIFPLLLLYVLWEWVTRRRAHGLEVDRVEWKSVRYALYILVIGLIGYFASEAPASFIYFQF